MKRFSAHWKLSYKLLSWNKTCTVNTQYPNARCCPVLTHTEHTRCHCSRLHFILSENWLALNQTVDVCVCVCEPVMGRVDKVNLNSKHNHKPVGPRKLTVNEENEKMFIHPQLFPPAHVCVYSCVCVCVVWTQLSGWCVWSHWQLHYGWCAQGDSTIQGKERRGQRHRRDRPGLLLGRPTSLQLLVEEGREEGGGEGGQLLSPLMSLCFFHQLSIYSAVRHSCPSTHTHTSL